MSHNRFRFTVVASWFTAIATLFALRLAVTTATLTMADVGLALAIMCAPALVFLIVFRAPQASMTQVLLTAEQRGGDVSRRDPTETPRG